MVNHHKNDSLSRKHSVGQTAGPEAQQTGKVPNMRGCPTVFWRRYFSLINTVMEGR